MLGSPNAQEPRQVEVARSEFQALLALGIELHTAGRWIEAVGILRQAVALDASSAAAHYHLGLALERLHGPVNRVAAEKEFATAARLEPNRAEPHFWHGMLLTNAGPNRAAEAEVALRRALELRPGWVEPMACLFQALLELDRPEEALPYLDRLVEHDARTFKDQRDAVAETLRAKTARRKIARYPEKNAEFADAPRVIDEYFLDAFSGTSPLIGLDTHVFTMGSCFAAHMARGLRRCSIPTEHVVCVEDINTTFANRALMQWLRDGPVDKNLQAFEERFDSGYRTHLRAQLEQAEIVIFSLGVAPCFFDRDTGEFILTIGVNSLTLLRMDRYVSRTTTVAENLDNLKAISGILREINPGLQLVLTVSPAPLVATFEMKSAIVADCISKSTLRVATHEFMQQNPKRTYYWPSFEMVRWCGAHSGPVFGADDGSSFHVNESTINLIINSFLRVFGKQDVRDFIGDGIRLEV